MAFFRGMLDEQMPMRLGMLLVLLDGLPIAGSIFNGYERRLYATQVIFDDGLAAVPRPPDIALWLRGMLYRPEYA